MSELVTPFSVLIGITQVVYLAVMFALGVRLWRLARRTGKQPETALALHFLLCPGLGYALLVTGLGASRQPGLLPADLQTMLIATGQLASCLGVFAEALFNFWVFRRGERWARLAVYAAGAMLAVGLVGYGLSGGFVHGRFEGPFFWMFYGTFAWVAAWVMVEPIRYHAVMRKRLPLGLADPMLVNRFLLWGVGSVLRFAMVVGGIVPGWLYPHINPVELEVNPVTASLLIVSLCGVGVAGTYWLAFFPNPAYSRWLTGDRSEAS